MPSAKKVISAEIHLNQLSQFNGTLFNFQSPSTPNNQQYREILTYFQEKYASSKIGNLEISLENDTLKFKWTLDKVVPEAEKLHKEALALARARDFKGAIAKWMHAISMNSQDPDYYFNSGIAFYEEKKYNEAIENLEQALAYCPIYFKARLILGTIYLKLRRFTKAEEHLKESIYFNPKNPLAILNLGAVYSILKKYDEGVNAFKKIIEISPNEPRAYFGLGKIYSIQGKVQEANECFKKVIEYDQKGDLANHAKRALVTENSSTAILAQGEPAADIDESNLEAYYAEGYNAYLYGDYARAGDLYRKYVEHKPKDDNVWFSLGEAYLRAGYPKEASAAFRNAIRIRKKGLYYKQLAITYDFLGLTEKALNAIEQAVSLGKKDSIVYAVWGKNLYKLNRYDEAIEKLQLALKINRANLSAVYHLAAACAKSQRIHDAVNYLHIILSSKISTPIRSEAEQLLAQIGGK